MFIYLNKIPKAGESFTYSQKDQELADQLEDLLGTSPFQIQFFIKPQSHHFEMTGEIETKVDRVCSRCAQEFSLPLKVRLREILIPHIEWNRKDHSSKSPLSAQESSFEVTEYRDDQLDVGEFLHEAIAFSDPLIPLCSPNCLGLCSSCGVNRNLESCSCAERNSAKNSPFAVLKKIKL